MKSLEKKTRSLDPFDMEPSFPSFRVDSEQMPEILKWKTGEEYKITVKIHQEDYHESDGEVPHARFTIRSYDTKNGKKTLD